MKKLWSKRQRKPTEQPDVYQYEMLPDAFRKQIIYILVSVLGTYDERSRIGSLSEPSANRRWITLVARYAREKGIFHLGPKGHENAYMQSIYYIQSASTEDSLDFIVCAFQFIDQDLRKDSEYWIHVPGQGYHLQLINEAISELNQRFDEHAIGYQFANGDLIKRTDQYIHEELTLPTLKLLLDPRFQGAQDEFLNSHQHYREQRYKEAVNDALKAFESTMKSILDEQKWAYNKQKDTSKTLLQILFDHHLIPPMLQNQFTQMRGLLESGIPTVRNKTSGHGQGAETITLPKYIAEYALHLTAANILFLIHAFEAYKDDHSQDNG